MTAFERALEINPGDSETYGMLGGRAKRVGDYEEARRWYRRGVELARDDPYMLINLAAMEIIVAPTAPERGIEAYRRLIGLLKERQDAPDEWYELNLGEAYFAIGDDARALEHYALARGLASTSKSLLSAADQLRVFADRGFRPTAAATLIAELSQGVVPAALDRFVDEGENRALYSSTSRTCTSGYATAKASIGSMPIRAGYPWRISFSRSSKGSCASCRSIEGRCT